MRVFLAGLVCTLSFVAMAATGPQADPTPAATLETGARSPKASRIIGGVEFRPSYRSQTGGVHMENYAQLGYQFESGVSLMYRQEYNANIYSPDPHVNGLEPYAYDGSLRAKFGDVWKDKETGWSLSYEARVYAPTYKFRRDAGMVTAIRNYARLKKELGSSFSITLEEVPILHAYNRPAAMLKRLGYTANPIFENRVYLDFEWKLPIKGVKLWFPIILNSVRHLTAGGAKYSGGWDHWLWIYPELTYALNKNVSVGVAYYSMNLIKDDFSGFTIGTGLQKGVTQLILNASL